ncbi:hypothetical protein R0K04_30065, partial [Pseudoalteromonas sp. SIMBA_153]
MSVFGAGSKFGSGKSSVGGETGSGSAGVPLVGGGLLLSLELSPPQAEIVNTNSGISNQRAAMP